MVSAAHFIVYQLDLTTYNEGNFENTNDYSKNYIKFQFDLS